MKKYQLIVMEEIVITDNNERKAAKCIYTALQDNPAYGSGGSDLLMRPCIDMFEQYIKNETERVRKEEGKRIIKIIESKRNSPDLLTITSLITAIKKK